MSKGNKMNVLLGWGRRAMPEITGNKQKIQRIYGTLTRIGMSDRTHTEKTCSRNTNAMCEKTINRWFKGCNFWDVRSAGAERRRRSSASRAIPCCARRWARGRLPPKTPSWCAPSSGCLGKTVGKKAEKMVPCHLTAQPQKLLNVGLLKKGAPNGRNTLLKK